MKITVIGAGNGGQAMAAHLSMLGHEGTLAYVPWPTWDEAHLKVDEVEILVQVLGKPKARLMMPVGCSEETAREIALGSPEVQAAINGRQIRKVICVPGRLVNIVVG